MLVSRTEHSCKIMGGPCKVLLDGCSGALAPRAISRLVLELQRLESKYSRYLPDSLVSRLNSSAGTGQAVTMDEETFGLCEYTTALWKQSDGLFDPTSGVLRRAWDFRSDRLPTSGEIRDLLSLIGWDHLAYDSSSWSLPVAGMQLDFGGLVKEYAVDSGKRVLLELGIEHALIDLAGDIATIGTQGDGKPWQVGVRHPRHEEQAVARMELTGNALASSGDYERSIVVNGTHYGHILSPRTGWPVAGLACASVVADQCLVAGSAATTAMLKTKVDGLAWLESLGLPWVALDRKMRAYGPLAVL